MLQVEQQLRSHSRRWGHMECRKVIVRAVFEGEKSHVKPFFRSQSHMYGCS